MYIEFFFCNFQEDENAMNDLQLEKKIRKEIFEIGSQAADSEKKNLTKKNVVVQVQLYR